jgi:gluconate 5-dehydrogenase
MSMSTLQLFDLAGRRALVTGASRGIGFARARGRAGAGAAMMINRRDAGRRTDAAAVLGVDGARVRTRVLEGPDHAASRAANDGFEHETGPIDIVINNAGMQHRAPIEEFPAEAFEAVMRTNVTSIFNVGQAAARHMIGRRRGKIINICSAMSALARPTIAPYTTSKGAAANLTKGMATDWARHGLNVNGIAPGYFKTELNKALVEDPAFTGWLEKRTPAGRWGDTGELVGAAVFLASDAATFVNGHILYVDGGLTISV